jgi:hypothetical protein
VRALICGAGITGLTLARLLDAMGWQVVLVERAAGLRDEGYLIDFFGPGFEAAESMGPLPRFCKRPIPSPTSAIWTSSADHERPSIVGGWFDHSTAACSACCAATSSAHSMKTSANECGNTTAPPLCALDQRIDRVAAHTHRRDPLVG